MNIRTLRKYAAIGVTAFLVIAASALFIIFIWRFDIVLTGLRKIINVLMPIIIGFSIAYILNPLCNFLERHIQKLFKKKPRKKLVHVISVLLSVLTFLAIVVGVLLLIIPQLIYSVNGLFVSVPGHFKTFSSELEKLLQNQDNEFFVYLSKQAETIISTIQSSLLSAIPQVSDMLGKVTQGAIGIITGVFNFIVGIIIAFYMLFNKDKMAAQFKKLLYALFPTRKVEQFLRLSRETNRIFNGFISGKILDCLIIGVICFLGTTILQIPYALLVSVIIAITNIIPFFGPFIGAIPCSIFILIVDPVKAIWFVIFIIVLQQIDGNILDPKIVGEYTGLSAFWVIFAITVGGGLFGILGMFVGVPVFAVLYAVLRTITTRKLKIKKLPTGTGDYTGLRCPKKVSGSTEEQEDNVQSENQEYSVKSE